MKSPFFTNKQSWWLIGFSMIISGGILVMPQMITSFILKDNLSGMWIIWSGVLGVAAGKAFFAHLWNKLPIKTENELILFRFSGKGAKILHIFRSLYVGGIIVPIVLSFSFIAFSRVCAFVFDISVNAGLIISIGIILIGTVFNSLRNRLKFDFISLIIFVISFSIILFLLFKSYGNILDLNEKINLSNLNFNLFPIKGSAAFTGFLVFISVQWWSASIIDMPDMNGQKLMAANNINEVSKSIIWPTMLFFVFNLLLYTLPVYILFVNDINSEISGEAAFFEIFKNGIPINFRFLIFVFFLIPFLSIVHNTQNWGGSLLVRNFYKYHIKQNADDKNLNNVGIVIMLLLVIISGIIAYFNDSLVDIFKFLFAITAGVGPVFILRWYWHKINAWSQLSAMISSLIFPFIYDFAYEHFYFVQNTVDMFINNYNIEYYPLKIVILTIVVCITWISITLVTKPTDKKTLDRFVNTVSPGGFWGKERKKGKVFFSKRILIWLLLSAKGILFYVLWWKFVSGNYWWFSILSVLYLLLLFTAYKVLLKVNSKYAQA